MKIIFPKTHLEIPKNIPVFFLAGPVRGGDDWQYKTTQLLQEQMGDTEFYVAIPYYLKVLPDEHPLFKIKAEGDDSFFERQLNWERHYIDLASKQGCLIFWLPEESKTNPRIGGGPYATDTRGELGEWRGLLMNNKNLHVVVGGEEGFDGFDVLSRNFKLAIDADFPIYNSLFETVAAAILKSKH